MTEPVEPTREMVELAAKHLDYVLSDYGKDAFDEAVARLAAEFTSVRSQAIAEAAGVADERAAHWHGKQVHDPSDGCDLCSAAIERTNEADTVAASIRSLR